MFVARSAPKGAVFVDSSVRVQKRRPAGDSLSFITVETAKGQPDMYADVFNAKGGKRSRLSYVQHGGEVRVTYRSKIGGAVIRQSSEFSAPNAEWVVLWKTDSVRPLVGFKLSQEVEAATEIKVPYDGPNSYLEVDSLLGPSR